VLEKVIPWIEAWEGLFMPSPRYCPLCQQKPVDIGLPGCWPCVSRLEIGWHRIPGDDLCFCIGPYQGQVKERIVDFKFLNRMDIGWLLGSLMGIAAREEPLLQDIRAIVPIPLHPAREKQRGFNQTRILADGISNWWKKPILDLLVRPKETKPQVDLNRHQRALNLANAFAMREGDRMRHQEVLLIDDICTTGTTFAAAASVVRRYGGKPTGLFVASGRIE